MNISRLIKLIFIGILIWLAPLLFSGAYAHSIKNDNCLSCHKEDVSPDTYKTSVHGKALCTSCHADINVLPHPENLSAPACNKCHKAEAENYNLSSHYLALKAGANNAASCSDCHGGPHAILSSQNKQSTVYRLNIPKTCARCHDDQAKMGKYALIEKMPFKSYSETVHGKALLKNGDISVAICTDCHGAHDLYSLNNPKSRIYRSNVPYTCGQCHEDILAIYKRSIHGKAALAGKREAPVCTDCHGEHTIRSPQDPVSSVYPTAISGKTCPHCHSAEKLVAKYNLPADRVKTYFQSYHGLASKYGSTTVANCASCHGSHNILPSSDPDSAVNKKNLAHTCRKCHPGAGEQLAKGSIHVIPSTTRDKLVFYVTLFYVFLIITVISGMSIYILLDYIHQLRAHFKVMKDDAKILRWTFNERLQHFLLFVTFTVLAYTGFALRYRQAWWALPFTVMKNGFDWRGLLHRIMAVIFLLLCLYHLWFMLFTKRGRLEFKALLPKGKDFNDLLKMINYNLGISQEKPKFERFNFIEKSEYWALIWGSLIMIITGLLLVFVNFTLRYFPKWVVDAAGAVHFYEAVLAVLAILIWHLYFSVFRPGHYPMDWSWITGRVSEGEQRENDPLEKGKED